jgi:hypothetical protein
MRLVRLFQQPVEEHPFVLAAKTGVPPRRRESHRATIAVESLPRQARPEHDVVLRVRIANTGGALWRADRDAAGHVRLGIQLLDGSSRVLARDFARVPLDADVAPGQARTVEALFKAPAATGDYLLKSDLVVEGVTWFEPRARASTFARSQSCDPTTSSTITWPWTTARRTYVKKSWNVS